MRRTLVLFFLLILSAAAVVAMDKTDWEEVNFAFNSSVLVDGFPAMLQLADILGKGPEYHILVEGHCDGVGSNKYNDQLAIKRAEAVRDFLVKYGARPEQVEVNGKGKREPKSDNDSREGRFMNRRVVFTLYREKDGVREVIKNDAPISTILRELEKFPLKDKLEEMGRKQDAILDKLGGLDKILDQMQALQDRQAKLEDEIARLKDQLRTGPAPVPAPVPMPPVPVEQKVAAAAPPPPGRPLELKDLSLLGFNLGATDNGDFTANVGARYFHRFSETLALQGQGEYSYYPERREFQFDVGMVKRYKFLQMGAFGSFKRVSLENFDGGNLAQASVLGEYLFDQGSVGGYFTHGFLREAVVGEEIIARNLVRETYLNALDQYGVMFQFGLPYEFLLEGNVGYIDRGDLDSKAGGTVRVARPLGDNWSWFVEGAFNESLVGTDLESRFAAGLRYGLWKEPTRGNVSEVVPVDVPRIRYDVRTRLVKTGNDAPVANAGPDQINVEAGTIHLDGSASYDPDGDAVTFAWTQVQGPAVALSGATTATPNFTAESDQIYVFRLRVTDPTGLYSVDDVTVTTRKIEQVEIIYFLADPRTIGLGETSTLSWKVMNAESVEILGIGPVQADGSSVVAPTATTEYTLVARGQGQEVRATVTIVVESVQILFFVAEPTQITLGQQARLTWKAINAQTVQLEGIGTVSSEGSLLVLPTQTITYTLIASAGSQEVRAQVTVEVVEVNLPPVAYAGPDQISRLFGVYTLDGSGSFDPEGQPLTYFWKQVDGPAVALSNPNGVVTSFEVTTTGTYVFELVVSDPSGAASSDRVQVTIY
jgi:hypothetical protein